MPRDAVASEIDQAQYEARLTAVENRLNELSRTQEFSETKLLETLKNARPGERLNFGNISKRQMEDAVNQYTNSVVSQTFRQTDGHNDHDGDVQRNPLDLGPHIKQEFYWWGVRLEVDHEGMLALAAGGAGVIAMLTAIGVTVLVAAIIAGVIGIWSAFDTGNGVIFFVSWTGVHWFTPR